MAAKKGSENEIVVDTSPTKALVVDSLIRDATIKECLLDLIDNAVDAARADLRGDVSILIGEADRVQPFKDYFVDIDLSQNRISIKDNCCGIGLDDLKNSVLRFGKQSEHAFGIGAYGVGLNRALFKLADKSKVVTRTGRSGAILKFDHSAYLKRSGWELPAKTSSKTSPKGTVIELTGLKPGVWKEVGDPKWQSAFKKEVSKRYYKVLAKGFAIKFSGKKLMPSRVGIRDDGRYAIQERRWKAANGVDIRIVSGQHVDHRFSAEPDSKKSGRNKQIGREYGWSIVCNDRTIVISDQTDATGWPPTWHNEYNGFVGYVHFYAKNPSLLPWNTKKSGVDNNNVAMIEALEGMKRLAMDWRQFSRKASKGKIDFGFSGKNGRSYSSSGGRQSTSFRSSKATASGSKTDHTQYRTALPADIDESGCSDKLLKLVHEAKGLDLIDNNYSGLLLLRTLSQVAAIEYLKAKRKLKDLKAWYFNAQNRNRAKKRLSRLPDDLKLAYIPSFDDICRYFLENGEVWGVESFSHHKRGMELLKNRKRMLNDVAHSPHGMVRPDEALAIRDEIVPLLRHLLNPKDS